MNESSNNIGIIGLGYVGLPLAYEFGKHFNTIGYDLDESRVIELASGYDKTGELEVGWLDDTKYLSFSSSESAINKCNIYIVAVPTPVDKDNKPDISLLLKATSLVGRLLKKNDYVIYESTVYPGCTEEDCVPILESISGLKFNEDFFCGYSPERINPGDNERKLPDIVKIISGSTDFAADKIYNLYAKIITAGIYRAQSIKVAEAAKIIENTQRDINIALINEFSLIFDRLGLDTNQVLDAAATKWNFLKFKPGLVGGHCIGVDPYYLATKALSVGYKPEIILAGRHLNDSMPGIIAEKFINFLHRKKIDIKNCNLLILGFTFKENCPDVRNTKVYDLYKSLKVLGCNSINVFDPYADPDLCRLEYEIELTKELRIREYDGVIVAVPHDKIISMGYKKIKNLLKNNSVIFDLKGIFDSELSDFRL